MHEDVLQKMRQLVRQGRYIISGHADDEMFKDKIGRHDIVHTILTGKIVERQHDRTSGELKYRVLGWDYYSKRRMEAVAKITPRNNVVIITTYIVY